jgi:glycosyltransferase involved in cell wall biosynthesis
MNSSMAAAGIAGPGVTVVIPAWGDYVGVTISAALASVHSQTGVDVNVIVVNNGDPPDSFANLGPVEVITTTSRLSTGEARNLGVAAASGRYVFCMDADDELLPGALVALVQEAERHPDAVAVAGTLVGSAGVPIGWPYSWVYPLQDRPRAMMVAETVISLFPLNACLMRTSVWVKTPGYGRRDEAAEDWPLGVSILLRGSVRMTRVETIRYVSRPGGRWQEQSRWRSELLHRRIVRGRLREDPATPPLLRAALPVLCFLHWVDVAQKPLRRGLRGLVPSRSGREPDPAAG